MSISAIAAAATVYDTVQEVAGDAGVSVAVAESVIRREGFATVLNNGELAMTLEGSLRAARALAVADGLDD